MKHALMPFRKRSIQSSHEWDYDPFARLSREIDNLMNTYHGRLSEVGDFMERDFGVELSETDRHVIVHAELPGMSRKDIYVSLDEDVLMIRAVRREQREQRKRDYHISEVNYGGVSRSIRLPVSVDSDRATARFKRGLLTLKLPKNDQSELTQKRIPVTVD
ncbi:Hsp20/alpha crystallin family protein [Pontiella agarivorans]|uniref:Hsp20/alpha crystallin family protein n=1 Tax=Pontiella agarivorans TaxID=3038953 RepID=A0ABU5MZI1_9BACT|nr:Hsp20/alpha crystallin family protein [Pontiella agarivorans]MDZ8119579.1 Hsp20/alpha crystallin family protein [Pontiella agarivorans]